MRRLQQIEIGAGIAFFGALRLGRRSTRTATTSRRSASQVDDVAAAAGAARTPPAAEEDLASTIAFTSCPMLTPDGVGHRDRMGELACLRFASPHPVIRRPSITCTRRSRRSARAPTTTSCCPIRSCTDGFAIHFDGQTYTVFAPKKTEFVVNGKKRSKHKLTHDERLVIGSCELRFAMVDEAPPVEAEAANTIADLDAYTKLFEFSDRLMHAARPRRAARRADGRGHRDHERRQGLPDPARGRDARRQGRAQPEPREHRRRGQPALRLDHREGGALAEARDRLATRCTTTSSRRRRASCTSRCRSVICVPLLDRGRLLGLIYVGNDSIRDLFQEQTLRVLTVFASQASLIVANALLLNELRARQQAPATSASSSTGSARSSARRRRCRQVFRKVEKIAPTDISRADHRRDRHRQGADRARDPQPLAARRQAVRHDQLRRDSREPARERAVRSRQGRVHRRGREQAGQVPGGRRRHAVPRRDRRDAARAAGEAAARAPGEGRVSASATRGPRPSTSASSPRRTATSRRRSQAAGSARTSTTGSTSSTSSCRRCASAATTCS